VGAPYAVRVYETTATPDDTFAFYDRAMSGWVPVSPNGAEGKARGYEKLGNPVIISVTEGDGKKRLVTVSEAGVRVGRGGDVLPPPHAIDDQSAEAP
jgi:hypothetical protein